MCRRTRLPRLKQAVSLLRALLAYPLRQAPWMGVPRISNLLDPATNSKLRPNIPAEVRGRRC